jgi:hypothetical protein
MEQVVERPAQQRARMAIRRFSPLLSDTDAMWSVEPQKTALLRSERRVSGSTIQWKAMGQSRRRLQCVSLGILLSRSLVPLLLGKTLPSSTSDVVGSMWFSHSEIHFSFYAHVPLVLVPQHRCHTPFAFFRGPHVWLTPTNCTAVLRHSIGAHPAEKTASRQDWKRFFRIGIVPGRSEKKRINVCRLPLRGDQDGTR